MKLSVRQTWKQGGFRRSILFFSCAALLAFTINLIFAIWAMSRGVVDGIGVIAESNCDDIRKLNIGVHVLINTLSTILLAGSNYCMQCLSAPTRTQVDTAHKHRRWMDIGVSSIRNMFSILYPEVSQHGDGRRMLLWLLLALSSLPLHLFYNSAVFGSISVNAYDVVMMTEDWVKTGNESIVSNKTKTSNPGFQLAPIRTAILEGKLKRLDVPACVEAYFQPFQSTHSDLVLIADGDNGTFGLQLDSQTARFHLDKQDRCGSEHSSQWMCNQYQDPKSLVGSASGPCQSRCQGPEMSEQMRKDVDGSNWKPFNTAVKYCYSMPSEEHCKLKFSTTLIFTVVGLNLVKAALMLGCALSWRKEPPLLTVGDAIASFLERPDESTEGMCLLTREDAAKTWLKYKEPSPSSFTGKVSRKWSAASNAKWVAIYGILALCLGLVILLYDYGASKIKGNSDVSTLAKLGIGAIDAKTFMTTPYSGIGNESLLQNVVLANTPQLIFSIVYFSYNGIFTTMSLATEWSRFGANRKGLRRSVARDGVLTGAQRSTYFLQLPYRHALPLLVVSGLLHWLISQSIFLVYLETYAPSAPGYDSTEHRKARGSHRDDVVTCGWSPLAVLFVLSLICAMVALLLGFGQRKLRTGMPVVSSCSAAIAAACHPAASASSDHQEQKAWEMELQWGVTVEPDGEMPGHCSFSSSAVSYPIRGGLYM